MFVNWIWIEIIQKHALWPLVCIFLHGELRTLTSACPVHGEWLGKVRWKEFNSRKMPTEYGKPIKGKHVVLSLGSVFFVLQWLFQDSLALLLTLWLSWYIKVNLLQSIDMFHHCFIKKNQLNSDLKASWWFLYRGLYYCSYSGMISYAIVMILSLTNA